MEKSSPYEVILTYYSDDYMQQKYIAMSTQE